MMRGLIGTLLAPTLLTIGAATPCLAADAAPPPMITLVQGDCALAMGGRDIDCKSVMIVSPPGKPQAMFSTIVDHRDFMFRGAIEEAAGKRVLHVDSVIDGRATPVATNPATGLCEALLDKGEVQKITCDVDQGGAAIKLVAVRNAEGVKKLEPPK